MSELESILDYLETTSLEPHDDYVSEFSYKEQKVLWEYIKQLEWENQKYKEIIDKAIEHLDLFISSENLSKYDMLKILMHTKKILKGWNK